MENSPAIRVLSCNRSWSRGDRQRDEGGEAEKGRRPSSSNSALTLRDKMEKIGKYRVAMTRTDDTFVALGDRVALARTREASLFVSIHADALARERAMRKAPPSTLSPKRPSDARAARLAEN